jgi:succinyl-CoA synthetase alpha subunit
LKNTTLLAQSQSRSSGSSPGALLPLVAVWATLVPLFLVEKAQSLHFLPTALGWLTLFLYLSGAASDKVAALEKAGVIVADSPAKIGSEMLKVGDDKHARS